jgi:hypothetical protein
MNPLNPQYPHALYALTTPEATRNANGSWVQAEPSWSLVGACREETNGKGSTITTTDGHALLFTALIQLPKGTARVNEGTEVAVADETLTAAEIADLGANLEAWRRSGKIRIAGTCAKFDKGRLHCRLWI